MADELKLYRAMAFLQETSNERKRERHHRAAVVDTVWKARRNEATPKDAAVVAHR